MNRIGAKVCLVSIFVVFLSSCLSKKLVPENQYLLNKNQVIGLNGEVSKSDLLYQAKIKPNRKVLFFKAHLAAYRVARKVGLKKIGEKPVLVDTSAVAASAENMQRYLIKKGYFDNQVGYELKQTKWRKFFKIKKLNVVYKVETGNPYIVKDIKYNVDNEDLKNLIELNLRETNLQTNKPIDFDKIGEERTRLNTIFKNNGFYYMNPGYIDFELDTIGLNHAINLTVNINKPDSGEHVRQMINSVLVIFETGVNLPDTIKNQKYQVWFVMNGMDITQAVIANNILLKRGEYFSQNNLETSYERLVNLNLFRSVNIEINGQAGVNDQINVVVRLKPTSKFEFEWQPQIISSEQRFNNSQSSRNWGLANQFSLRNKNVFHNGEEFNINHRTALEMQQTRDSNSLFSTFVQEINAELKVPQLLLFRNRGNSLKISSVATNFSASYLFETNPFYKRNLFPLSYTYVFTDKKFSANISPLVVSLNKAEYKDKLLEQASQSYIETLNKIFTNNLITASRVSGYYTNRKKYNPNYFVLNSNLLELAGLFLPQLTDYGQKLGVHHSTFIRSDADYRYHHEFNKTDEIVFRFFGGIGVPIGSKSSLPYERRFISGGSNYLRGWRIRTVGPGSFSAANNLQLARTGEMSLLGNVEYRFNMFEGSVDLNGAIFVDAGNVWNLKADTLFPNGDFSFDRFGKELALNTGFGFRFDFEFLVVRADLGIPVWDPNYNLDERLVIRNAFKDNWIFTRPVWSVAVGYPF
ncbi:MAG: BamA/TamA family outer membrane protein [Flavobacteriales bacterium]|nr:BamA/TamA family outer membrane protein [Flavobacteriales bacterium]